MSTRSELQIKQQVLATTWLKRKKLEFVFTYFQNMLGTMVKIQFTN